MHMKIDTKVVDELAHLARLSYENEAKQEIVTELNKIHRNNRSRSAILRIGEKNEE